MCPLLVGVWKLQNNKPELFHNASPVDEAMASVHKTISGVGFELLSKTIDVGERSVNRLGPADKFERRTPIEGEGLHTKD
jgi:hypothetical protein